MFSPDGSGIAFLRGWVGGVFQIHILGIRDGKPDGESHPLIADSARRIIYDLRWSPHGTELLYTTPGEPALWRVSFPGGKPRPAPPAQNARSMALDRFGRTLVYAAIGGDADIWRMPGPEAAVTSGRVPLIRSTRDEGQPRYSPDGQHVAFMSNRSGKPNIWVADADGANPRQLTDHKWAIMPQWSPDGESIAYGSFEPDEGYSEIYTIGLQDAQPTQLTHDRRDKGIPIWSPDGNWIFFNRRPDTNDDGDAGWQIWKVPPKGGESQVVNPSGQVPLGVDDRFVYFHRGPGAFDRGQIWGTRYDGGEESLVLDENVYCWEWCTWRDRLIYVDRFRPEGPSIRALRLDTRDSETLALLDPESFPGLLSMQGDEFLWGGLTASPDGKWILYGKHTFSEADLMVIEAAR